MPFLETWPCSEVMACSDVYSVPASRRTVTWENWPPHQVSWQSYWFVSLVQYSHDIFHKLLYGAEHLFPSIFTLLEECHLFPIKDTATTVHIRVSQGNTGRPGMCLRLSEITSKALNRCSMISWKVDAVTDSRLPMAGQAHRLPPVPVSCGPQPTTQNPAECSISKVNGYLATRADQKGWGRRQHHILENSFP